MMLSEFAGTITTSPDKPAAAAPNLQFLSSANRRPMNPEKPKRAQSSEQSSNIAESVETASAYW
uniref:Uncharacterized protein n=1 Tax=Setaria italica TaxID=4555 RepID=K3YBI0_SETIT